MRSIPLFFGDEKGLRDATDNKKKDDLRRSAAKRNPAFGRTLKKRRTALGITQVEFAEEISIHQVTLSRLESGTNPLTTKMERRITTALDRLEGEA